MMIRMTMLPFYVSKTDNMKVPYSSLLISISILLSSCATLLNKQPQTSVAIISDVPNTEVYDLNNKLIGTTPFVYKIRKPGKTVFETKRKGYKNTTGSFQVAAIPKYAFMDAVLLCIPCIVDAATGKIFQVSTDTLNIQMNKKYQDTVFPVIIIFDSIQFAKSEGKKIGIKDNNTVTFYSRDYVSNFVKERMSSLSANPPYKDYISGVDNIPMSDMRKAFHIVMDVTDIKYDTYKFGSKTHYKVRLNYVTNIYNSTKENLIYSISDKTDLIAEEDDLKQLISNTIIDAYSRVINDDALFALLQSKQSFNGEVKKNEFSQLLINNSVLPSFAKYKEQINYLKTGTVTIQHESGHGSGFIISKDGYILTNYHVVEDRKELTVILSDGNKVKAKLIRNDMYVDAALLKIDTGVYAGLQLLTQDTVSIGENVVAIGTPTNIDLGQTVTKGIVSAIRNIDGNTYIQTDVAINKGNSGGPLLNDDGYVVGVVSAKIIGKGIEGLGFCIPINVVLNALNITVQ